MATHPGRRLGTQILTERSIRWPHRKDFALATGLSVRLLADIEGGTRTNYSARTFAAIEAALGWEGGTCERILGGGRIQRSTNPSLRRVIELWPLLSDDVQRSVATLVETITEY